MNVADALKTLMDQIKFTGLGEPEEYLYALKMLKEAYDQQRQGDAAELGQRAAHYPRDASGKQPWDWIKLSGWGPEFAAGNALKYARRYATKNGEDDLNKGRWYYHELAVMVADYSNHMTEEYKNASYVFPQLDRLLTTEERALLRNK